LSRPNFARLLPPPRTLPASVRLEVLCGGLAVPGFLLLALLSPFAWLFAGQADLLSTLLSSRGVVVVEGRVTGVRQTRASVGGRRVFEVAYQFSAPDGAQRAGRSYTTGRRHEVGQSVRVEYLAPELSRIEGARRTLFGPVALVSLLFPALGAALAIVGVRSGARTLRLLRDGQLASASLVKREATNWQINDRPVELLSFEYSGADGVSRTLTQRTAEAGELTDERREALLYLPESPERATLVDALPKVVAVNEQGELVSGAGSALVLVAPVLALLVNGAFAALRFAR
jgi:hypothetical protein